MTNEKKQELLDKDYVDETILMATNIELYEYMFIHYGLNRDNRNDRETAKKYLKQTLN